MFKDKTKNFIEEIDDFDDFDEDKDINLKVGKYLIENNISISSCESMTGGLFAAKLVENKGISKVFNRGIVTYSKDAKVEELFVKRKTIEDFTAESSEVALEMVRGLRAKTHSQLNISITGLANNELDEQGKVLREGGIFYIGIIYEKKDCNKLEKVVMFDSKSNDREFNINFAVKEMLNEIKNILE